MSSGDSVSEGSRAGAAKSRRYAKFGVVAALSLGHEVPSALASIMVPTLFVKEPGLPVAQLGWFALPTLVTALKWSWAPWIDRNGGRRAWIALASTLVALLYLAIGTLTPSLENFALVIGMLLLVALAFSTYEIAADAYVVDALDGEERAVGSGFVWLGKELGQIIGLAGLLVVADVFGWRTAFSAAALLFVLVNAAVFVRSEERPPGRSERAQLRLYLRHAVHRRLLLLVFGFAFAVQIPSAVIGPFLASKGLSLSEVGASVGIAASLGALLSLAAATAVVSRFGVKRTTKGAGLVAALALPGFLWIAQSDAPSFGWVAAVVFVGALATAPLRMLFYAARLEWTGPEQSGTDFTLQQSTWFLGHAAALVVGSRLAAAVGWTALFAIDAFLIAAALLAFITSIDGIDRDVRALREARA